MTSTAVRPYFKVTWRKDATRYVCRDPLCHFDMLAYAGRSSREVRMIVLASHLRDAHWTGPLARVTVP